MLMEFYIEHTEYTDEEIVENIQTDWYIRIEEAIEKAKKYDLLAKEEN